MRAKIKVWHQTFLMKAQRTSVKYHEFSANIPLREETSTALMKIAITGEKSFSDEFKRLNGNLWSDSACRNAIQEACGATLNNAVRILVEFAGISNFVFVYLNSIRKIDKDRYDEPFVVESDLRPIE